MVTNKPTNLLLDKLNISKHYATRSPSFTCKVAANSSTNTEDYHKIKKEINTSVMLELATNVQFSAWTWKICRTSSITWHKFANTMLIPSIYVKCADVALYIPDMAWPTYKYETRFTRIILPPFHNVVRPRFLRFKFDRKFNQWDRLRREQKYHWIRVFDVISVI